MWCADTASDVEYGGVWYGVSRLAEVGIWLCDCPVGVICCGGQRKE